MKFGKDERRPVRGITCIMFDMDGVLFLSNKAHEQAYREVLSPFGVHDFDYGRVAGMRTDAALRLLLEERGVPVNGQTLPRLVKQKQLRALEILRETQPLAPDCREVLSQLSVRYRLALVSSSSAASMSLFLELSHSRELFEVVVHGLRIRHAKPFPDIYLATISQLGVAANQTLVLEDSISGIRAARAAGAYVVAITGTCSATELEHEGADTVIRELPDMLKLLM